MTKILKITLALSFSVLLFSCGNKKEQAETTQATALKEGIWRATLSIQGQELPFPMEVLDSNKIDIINGEERLAVEATFTGDSVIIPMHIFDTVIKAKIEEGKMEGIWKKNYAIDYSIPFKAEFGVNQRFKATEKKPVADISGKWSVTFYEDEGEGYEAIGLFDQKASYLSGTFLTATGDYRYLDGAIQGNKLMLSAFDGEHAYLFTGTIQEDSITQGKFWSGKSSFETWKAVKNPNATLPDPDALTYLKEGYDKISFSFPDLEGNMVSLSDKQYQNKVVILQLFGTWCPNCLDETLFLSGWYKKNDQEDLAIIGLAYERKADFEYARDRVQKMIKRLDVPYDFLIAGTSDKESAAKSLPMLNHVMSFPTTIIIDKKGRVRKIHTGFSGPGTGKYYEQFVEEFNLFMDKLLAES